MQHFRKPQFKRLAHNDTASAVGHQGGIVIPKSMAHYFPELGGKVSAQNPTVDRKIQAALFLENAQVGFANTRYQYQTWGGKRSPERRLTGELGPLRHQASAGDYIVFERSVSDPDCYRLTLHKAGTAGFKVIAAKVGTRRWGPVD